MRFVLFVLCLLLAPLGAANAQEYKDITPNGLQLLRDAGIRPGGRYHCVDGHRDHVNPEPKMPVVVDANTPPSEVCVFRVNGRSTTISDTAAIERDQAEARRRQQEVEGVELARRQNAGQGGLARMYRPRDATPAKLAEDLAQTNGHDLWLVPRGEASRVLATRLGVPMVQVPTAIQGSTLRRCTPDMVKDTVIWGSYRENAVASTRTGCPETGEVYVTPQGIAWGGNGWVFAPRPE